MDSKNYIPRTIENYAFEENLTGRHMVFIAGPRQVGKTLFVKNWPKFLAKEKKIEMSPSM